MKPMHLAMEALAILQFSVLLVLVVQLHAPCCGEYFHRHVTSVCEWDSSV